MEVVIQMKAYGDNIPNQTVVAKMLGSLPPWFDHIIVAHEARMNWIDQLKKLKKKSFIWKERSPMHEKLISSLAEDNEEAHGDKGLMVLVKCWTKSSLQQQSKELQA